MADILQDSRPVAAQRSIWADTAAATTYYPHEHTSPLKDKAPESVHAPKPLTQRNKGQWVVPELEITDKHIKDPIGTLPALKAITTFAAANLDWINNSDHRPIANEVNLSDYINREAGVSTDQLAVDRSGGVPADKVARLKELYSATAQLYKYEMKSPGGLTMARLDVDKKGIESYEKLRQAQKAKEPKAYAITSYGIANFQRLDGDHDGWVSKNEINTALRSSSNPEEIAVLKDIKAVYNDIPHQSSNPIHFIWDVVSPPEINAYRLQTYVDTKYLGQEVSIVRAMFEKDYLQEDRKFRNRVLK